MAEEGHGAGLMGGASRLAGTALEAVRTRLELLGLELAEEREHLIRSLMWGAVALLFLAVGLLGALLWLALSFPEQRLWILGWFTLGFLVVGGLLVGKVLRAGRRPHPFHSSVAELAEDIRLLKEATRDDHPD